MSEFTTRELAQEMLIWFNRDIPETVVKALRIVLTRYVETGIYDDGMTAMLGYRPEPVLAIQRFTEEGLCPSTMCPMRWDGNALRELVDGTDKPDLAKNA